MIQRKSVRNLNRYLVDVGANEKFYAYVQVSNVSPDILGRYGLAKSITEGARICPWPIGPKTKFNVWGKNVPLKDMPKIKKYREAVIKDWHGNYHDIDIPYMGYMYEHIDSPNVELTVIKLDNELVILSPVMKNDNSSYNLHVVNLFLEVFGECDFLHEDLTVMIKKLPIERVNWEILPEGKLVWEKVASGLGISQSKAKKKLAEKYRFEHLDKHMPAKVYQGMNGFHGYLVFDFPKAGVVIMENMLYGNATYVIEHNWEEVSKLTKGEVIANNLAKDRVVHSARRWKSDIDKILS